MERDPDTAYSLYDPNIPSFIRVSDTTGRKPGPLVQPTTFWNPERVRMLLVLVEEGITHKNIAPQLGTTEYAVGAKVRELRKKKGL